ncbi:MAG: hypothetical protein K6A65_06380 [Succinivibrionaceae bacterium]|nr:hypothetical protein [Succinivibrionaceae bacterium]
MEDQAHEEQALPEQSPDRPDRDSMEALRRRTQQIVNEYIRYEAEHMEVADLLGSSQDPLY